jgi:hypothetical protein
MRGRRGPSQVIATSGAAYCRLGWAAAERQSQSNFQTVLTPSDPRDPVQPGQVTLHRLAVTPPNKLSPTVNDRGILPHRLTIRCVRGEHNRSKIKNMVDKLTILSNDIELKSR